MIHDRYKRLLFITLSILIIDAGTFSAASEDFPIISENAFGAIFNEEQSLKDEELDELRGGFLTSNGMTIDFAFSTNTLVDGQLINQVVLNSVDQSITGATSLRNIIQIGEGNSAFSNSVDIGSLPNVLTIVQNNLNDLTIQQVNLLDLQVQNYDNFIQQNIVPELTFQSTFRLVP